jgi:prepilin-type N-terminal cleavage/methylation domain-containing protein
MRSRRNASSRQRGYSLFEVMAASIVLSVFVLGIGSMYTRASVSVGDTVMRQKALFALNSEMERLTAMYLYTSFGNAGAVSTDTYAAAPATRLIYPTSVAAYVTGAGNDFTTTTAATFAANDFMAWHRNGAGSNLDRLYVWIDRDRNVMGQVSWTTTDIVLGSCTYNDCRCLGWTAASGSRDWCRQLTLYIDYPYHYLAATGGVVAPSAARLRTITLKTIVGRV